MRFVQATYFTRTPGRQIDLVVIHDMEAPEKATTAEGVAGYFASGKARASAHYNVDVDSVVQSVRDEDVAWHAPGANHNGIGVELAGYARQTAAEWLDEYSKRMLEAQAAPLVRELCRRYSIPVRFVDRHGLLRGERGITTHNEVSQAFRRSSHWDPGPHFPMAWFLEQVAHGMATLPPTVPAHVPVAQPAGARTLKAGMTGPDVVEWQKILVGAGHQLATDGDFGPKTEAATKAFQAKLGVTADGVVGPKTRETVARLFAYLRAVELQKAAKPAPAPAARPTIRQGDTGEAVKHAQRRLNAHGFGLKVDGDFGPRTDVAVRRFQKGKGLRADGIIGPRTWGELG